MRSGNPECDAFVRVHGVDYPLVKRYLDAGARGVVGPLVNNKAQAEMLVSACKYPPEGKRGVGFCRANGYGAFLEDECARANQEGTVVVQIEDIEAVRNIDEIFSVPGVDAAFIGPYDLTASMGITGDFQNPEFVRARERILNACTEHKIAAGIHVTEPNPDEVSKRIDEGFRLIAYSLDVTILLRNCISTIQALRRHLD
jgi:2-dehydro-3-deoxyglucarate aldolase